MSVDTILKAQLENLRTRSEFDEMAASLYGVGEDSEGTTAQRFIAGWVNACDMGGDLSDSEFRYIALSEINK